MASLLSASSCFWCHSCHRIFRLPSPSILLCPLCNEGFVEEINGLSLHPRVAFILSGEIDTHSHSRRDELLHHRRSPFSQVREMLSVWRSQSRQSGFPGAEEGQHSARSDGLNLILSRRNGRSESFAAGGNSGFAGLGSHLGESFRFLERFQSFFSRRRGRSTIGDDILGLGRGSPHSSGPHRLEDVRDFLLGPGGDLLVQQLMEGADARRHGSAPASKDAVEAMPTLTISKQSLEADDIYCAVCKEVFDIGVEAREMPCKHIYHSNCILPWLALHSSCPICRQKMPSEARPDNQGRRADALLDTNRPDGDASADGTGERSLAIVGIPGIGILVRSFLLLGNSVQSIADGQNQAFIMGSTAQAQDLEATPSPIQASMMDFSSHNVDALTQSLVNTGSESVNSEELFLRTSREVQPLESTGSDIVMALQHTNNTSSDVGDDRNWQTSGSQGMNSTESSAGRQGNDRRSRNFFSWLARRASSFQAHPSDVTSGASNSSLRRRRVLF